MFKPRSDYRVVYEKMKRAREEEELRKQEEQLERLRLDRAKDEKQTGATKDLPTNCARLVCAVCVAKLSSCLKKCAHVTG